MANKFTQSVLERLEQESKSSKQNQPQGKALAPSVETSEQKPLSQERSKEIKKEPRKKTTDLLDQYFVSPSSREAKNKTYYLDQRVIDGIHQAAKKRGVADSRLVNDILSKVLGFED